ncbi:MAG: MarR family transcriptional regulator [Clostridiales Family XIII bacterium]|jgi:DNA-binding MarR family transcriptional regulator|nr:MarR family transcriptional regulator [Clostridiales Family XIII bacterium]
MKKNTRNEAFPELAPCHCANIRWMSREVSRFYENALSESGLKLTQYALLSSLKFYGPLTMNALSRVSRLERTTLVRKLKPLQSEGFIRLSARDASNANLVSVTDRGLAILDRAEPLWNRAQALFRERFDAEEWAHFVRVLLKLSKINGENGAQDDEARR